MSARHKPTEEIKEQKPSKSYVVKAARPARRFFDPWNSGSTGHQRAESRLAGSTSWRDSRSRKLKAQFNDRTGGGGVRIADSVGAGRETLESDGRLEDGGWIKGAPGLRAGGQRSIQQSAKSAENGKNNDSSLDGERMPKRRRLDNVHTLQGPAPAAQKQQSQIGPFEQAHLTQDTPPTMQTAEASSESQPKPTPTQTRLSQRSNITSSASTVTTDAGFSPTVPKPPLENFKAIHPDAPPNDPSAQKSIFRGLSFYINGSTYPEVSDHKLKQMIGQHGGSLSLGLARRTVTHVIVGELSRNGGCGGGLAGSKIQKKAALGGKGEGVKYVKAGWVLESVRQMRRVSEADYLVKDIGTGGAKQRTVMSMIGGE